LENGIRHATEGGVVRISCREEAGAIEIAVEDDGPGVAPEDRERVFEPFFRGAKERSSDVPGAGLGLSIAREIARQTGGDLVLDAKERTRGARFVARWPRGMERTS
jgi:signal transduction histidine kinase